MDQSALKEWLHEPLLKLTQAIVVGLEQHLKSLHSPKVVKALIEEFGEEF